MLVYVPTREDVLAIRSLDEAFDLWTPRMTRREVALIRIAAAEGLLEIRHHAHDAAEDESIIIGEVVNVVRYGNPASKDVDAHGSRQVGINFEGKAWGRAPDPSQSELGSSPLHGDRTHDLTRS